MKDTITKKDLIDFLWKETERLKVDHPDRYMDDLILEGHARLIIRPQKYWEASYKQLMDFPEIEQKIINDTENKHGKLICENCKKEEFRISGMYDFEIGNSGEEIRKYCFSCNGCGKVIHRWAD